MVSVEQFKRGADLFFSREIFPKLPEEKKFPAAFGTALLISNIEKNAMVQSLGLIPEAGVIDLEQAYSAARSASNVAPLIVTLPIIGQLKFGQSDIDRLYQTILSV